MKKIRQAGAIPFRRGETGWEFLLITSSKGNWIFPKGVVAEGETAEMTARKETREEAGIDGEILREPLGSYRTSRRGEPCDVQMFLLKYRKEAPRWDEQYFRSRKWCSLEEAHTLLKRKELKKLLKRAHRVLVGKSA